MKIVKQVVLNFVKSIKSKFFATRTALTHIEFRQFFPVEVVCFTLGYPFLEREILPAVWKRINGILIQICLVILLFVLSLSAIILVRNFHQNDDSSIFVLIENISFIGIDIALLTKIFLVFHYRRPSVLHAIEIMRKYFPQSTADQFSSNTYNYLTVLMRFYKTYKVIIISLEFIQTSMPYLHQLYGIYMNVEVQWELIFSLSLPFDLFQPIVYESVFIVEIWLISFGMCFILSTDFTFVSLIQIMCLEFDILGQAISEISLENREKEAIEELKKLINVHQELIEASETIEEIFSFLLFVNISGSITALCTMAFLSVVSLFKKNHLDNLHDFFDSREYRIIL